MSDYWFTADNHFEHPSIIKHCKRPFSDIHEMRSKMVDNWNAIVRPRDIVVILGDFSWDINYDAVTNFAKSRLNGAKLFIKGNHDRWFKKDKRHMYNKKIKGVMCWCCHYPLRTWPSGVNLHGHSHGVLDPKIPNQFDVGVDVWNYRPVHIDEIKELIDETLLTRKQRGEIL